MSASNLISKEDRLSVRMPREIKNRLSRAAAIQGQTLSDFIVANMLPVAESVIKEHLYITVSERDYEILMKALNNPPKPNAALLKAVKAYKESILNGEIIVED
jgi:uncharacterized protein (DUF1778 family)